MGAPLRRSCVSRPFGNSQTPTDETWWNGSWDPFTISIGKTFQENSKGSFLADDLSMCKGVFLSIYTDIRDRYNTAKFHLLLEKTQPATEAPTLQHALRQGVAAM